MGTSRVHLAREEGAALIHALGGSHSRGGSGPHGGARRPPSARSVATTRAEAMDPDSEVGLHVVLDDDTHGGSEGSVGHPTRALPPVEIDLPEGARSGSGGG